MKSILLAHARKYPLMEPTDAVKLIYQNEFGGGHLISDTDACLDFLHREYRATPQDSNVPLTEDIGNGIVRVNLAALDAHNLSPEELGQSFIRSASLHKGSMDSFLNKLSILPALTQAGHMPFSSAVLERYLSEYQAAGYPPVSHSCIYRNTYRPAYRVVAKICLSTQVL